jgi:radical SAM additional 4Fe4S-binding domain
LHSKDLLETLLQLEQLLHDESSVQLIQGQKLVVHVSHDCNLRCQYCYASHGSYGRELERGLMSDKVALSIVEKFASQDISRVVFFGGEPLLNLSAMKIICEGFREKGLEPEYCAITNGTLFTDQVKKLVEDFSIQLTVSIDGPKDIHDELRPFVSGQGSHDEVIRTIGAAKRMNVPLYLEATYTQLHENAGLEPQQILDYLRNEVGVSRGTMGLCKGSADDGLSIDPTKRKLYSSSLTEYIGKQIIDNDNPYIDDDWLSWLVHLLRHVIRPSLCPIGDYSLSILPNGDIYPCHLFVSSAEMKLGNLFEDSIDACREQAKTKIPINDKTSNPKCASCWLKNCCRACVADIYSMQGHADSIPDWVCEGRNELYRDLLTMLLDLQEDPTRWSKFIHGLANILDKLPLKSN